MVTTPWLVLIVFRRESSTKMFNGNRKATIYHVNTSVFFTRDESTVPFSYELLPYISILKKLWMVVPFILVEMLPHH